MLPRSAIRSLPANGRWAAAGERCCTNGVEIGGSFSVSAAGAAIDDVEIVRVCSTVRVAASPAPPIRTVGPSAVVATAESESAVGIFGAAVSLPLEGSIAITVSSAVPTSSRPPAT